jgi:hypothetical protein
MKNIKFILTGLILATFIGAKAQTSGELIVPLSDPAKRATVKVDIKKGSITVIGSARKDVKITYKVRASKESKNSEKDGLKRISSGAVDLQASESNNRVSIGSDSWNQGLDLTVEVPSNVDLNVETYNSGDIEVDNIVGEVVSLSDDLDWFQAELEMREDNDEDSVNNEMLNIIHA